MRILVFSDSHMHTVDMINAVEQHPEAKLILHLGDNEKDTECIKKVTDTPVMQVCGNCDMHPKSPISQTVTCLGKKIFFTHGHEFYVKSSTGYLLQKGREEGADIILFGHTHVAVNQYIDGIYLFNPGSISLPRNGIKSYGMIDIEEGGVFMNLVEINRRDTF